jgi:hypothetical protein
MNAFEQSLVQANRPVVAANQRASVADLNHTFKLDKHIGDSPKKQETSTKDA